MKNFFYKNFNNAKLRYVYLVIIALFFFGFGYIFADFSHKNVFSMASASDTPVEVPALLKEVRNYLDNSFISWKNATSSPSEKDLSYGMIKGYVNTYNDPYTQFFTPDESKQFEEDIKGSFGGIGAMIGYKEKTPVIMSVLKNTPAEKSGLKAGDLLISVDGKMVGDMSVEQIVRIVRGEIGSKVTLEVIHKDESKSTKITITRAEVKVPIIETEIKDNVFIIHFYSFTEDSATRFEAALQEFMKSNKTNLIVDLRGNGGGYLDSAIDIASFFLPSNKIIVTEKNNKSSEDKINYSRGYNYFSDTKVKVVVLIDGGSASASEIVAGALKDNGVAKVVGEKSFGKGSVQQLIKLSDGSDLKVTVAKWYTPNGVNISENGIVPDIVATTSSKISYDKSGKAIDTQLIKAISIIKSLK